MGMKITMIVLSCICDIVNVMLYGMALEHHVVEAGVISAAIWVTMIVAELETVRESESGGDLMVILLIIWRVTSVTELVAHA